MLIKYSDNFLNKEKFEIFFLNLFAFSGFCAFGVANTVMAILCAYALINYKEIVNYYKETKIFYLFSFYAVYISVSVFVFADVFPETQKIQMNSIYWWLAPWAFLIISWLIRGREHVAFQMLQFAFIGFLLRILLKSDWSLYRIWLSGGRYGFSYPWLVTSLFCVVSLAGFFIFRDKIIKNKVGIVFYYIFGLPFILFVMAINQSRGMFVIIALIFLCTLFVFVKNLFYSSWNNKNFSAISFIVLIGSLILISQYRNIKNRFIDENYLYEKIIKFNVSEIPYSSIGARIHFIDYGIKLVMMRPFFGWGPGTSAISIAKENDIGLSFEESRNLSQFCHLHNLFVEIMVRFGFVGIVIHLSIITYLFWLIFKNKKNMDSKFYLLLIYFIALNIYFNLYDFRYINQDYRNLVVLFFSIFLSLSHSKENVENIENKYITESVTSFNRLG